MSTSPQPSRRHLALAPRPIREARTDAAAGGRRPPRDPKPRASRQSSSSSVASPPHRLTPPRVRPLQAVTGLKGVPRPRALTVVALRAIRAPKNLLPPSACEGGSQIQCSRGSAWAGARERRQPPRSREEQSPCWQSVTASRSPPGPSFGSPVNPRRTVAKLGGWATLSLPQADTAIRDYQQSPGQLLLQERSQVTSHE